MNYSTGGSYKWVGEEGDVIFCANGHVRDRVLRLEDDGEFLAVRDRFFLLLRFFLNLLKSGNPLLVALFGFFTNVFPASDNAAPYFIPCSLAYFFT